MVVLVFVVLTGLASPARAAGGGLVGDCPIDEGIGNKMAWRKTERRAALDFDGSKASWFKIPTSPYWDYAPGFANANRHRNFVTAAVRTIFHAVTI